jgi:hypothetical protein
MRVLPLTFLLAWSAVTAAQPSPQPASPWQMQDSGTTASLRGIHSVDGSVAWASGTGGTVLKTTDGGQHWQPCSIPDGDKDGATLDFRGIQAWDSDTAIVMASGPGEKSRLYRTSDGCKKWKLILKNKDKAGFWDALHLDRGQWGWLLGDPVNGAFSLFASNDAGKHWIKQHNAGLRVKLGSQGAFAASNSSLAALGLYVAFGSGGTGGALVYSVVQSTICVDCSETDMDLEGRENKWDREPVLLGKNTDSSGVFSIDARPGPTGGALGTEVLVIVGGDYSSPNDARNTAAFRLPFDHHWTASTTPPHGYRSTVQWSEAQKLWISAGTNGSDISRDDGRTWQPLDNGNWNALSLPFIVGPNGRIAKLNPSAIPMP